ncbi:B-cell receptor CD22-like isoform X1 [Carassius auratus]|uniref:B-cell receptor CD22 n=1 Tax=Carassius auratus TaxID=7957 RepID=A0A6P6QX87_CARAU|nr:B-cell receptor CD22-like isoform X1 [Carassius auratus]
MAIGNMTGHLLLRLIFQADRMMIPEGIPLLLLVLLMGSFTGSNNELIKVLEKTEQIDEGSCVTIPCSYKKTKDGKYTLLWFKDPEYNKISQIFDGTILYSNTEERPQSPGYSSRVKYITDETSQENQNIWIKCDLRITDLQTKDSGNYKFRFIISSYMKYMSAAMNLKVTDNPCKVHIEPSELKSPVRESDKLTVRCSTFGSCDLHPEWLVHTSRQKQKWTSSSSTDMIIETEEDKEGRKITKLKLSVTWKDDRRILSCRPAKSEDSCQIRNITLSVEYAPKEVKATVSSEDVKEGDSVTLSCTSRGQPDVSFSWFKKERIEKSQQMSDLKLNNVKPEDSGEYYCEAENKHGVKKSNIIQIDVKYGPEGVKVQPVNIKDLKEGDELTLKCLVERGNPAVYQFMWYKNSQNQSETSETFIISKVTEEDRGSYQCQADNGIRTEISDILEVSVKYAPENVTVSVKGEQRLGSELTLTCEAHADPAPSSYEWKKGFNGQLKTIEQKHEQRLHFLSLEISDSGQYACIAQNSIGKTESPLVEIKVKHVPIIKIAHNMTTLTQWNWEFPVSLTCSADAHPPAKVYNWYREEDNVTVLSEHQNFTVQPQNPGIYYCTAANAIGESRSENIMLFIGSEYEITHLKYICSK